MLEERRKETEQTKAWATPEPARSRDLAAGAMPLE